MPVVLCTRTKAKPADSYWIPGIPSGNRWVGRVLSVTRCGSPFQRLFTRLNSLLCPVLVGNLFIRWSAKTSIFSDKSLFPFTSNQQKCKNRSSCWCFALFYFTNFERYVEKCRPFKKKHHVMFKFQYVPQSGQMYYFHIFCV